MYNCANYYNFAGHIKSDKMKIIIAGDGETGTHLAEMLSVENQNIVLMGTNADKLGVESIF